MDKLVTKYSIFSIQHMADSFGVASVVFRRPDGVPSKFDSHEAALDWVLSNPEVMRYFPEFTIMPLYTILHVA